MAGKRSLSIREPSLKEYTLSNKSAKKPVAWALVIGAGAYYSTDYCWEIRWKKRILFDEVKKYFNLSYQRRRIS